MIIPRCPIERFLCGYLTVVGALFRWHGRQLSRSRLGTNNRVTILILGIQCLFEPFQICQATCSGNGDLPFSNRYSNFMVAMSCSSMCPQTFPSAKAKAVPHHTISESPCRYSAAGQKSLISDINKPRRIVSSYSPSFQEPE